jgi:RNA-directed DNA polymerase
MTYTSLKTTEVWKNINWRVINRRVFRIQKRIYRASERGDVGTMRGLQKLLLRSCSAKLLALRRVTQDNQGKKTAGIDGIKAVKQPERLKLAKSLKLGDKAKPTRNKTNF